ncbi:MAG: hypothetical protein U9R29_01095 [Thermodesulfobacteriota bacterium]|nr:hypothetical protein [Thermodesulfobacteriota bacterium]
MRVIKLALLSLTIALIVVSAGICSDLDDGISKFTDDNISKWDDLGKNNVNVKFIKLKARSQADVRSKRGKNVDAAQGGSGGANMNSVVLGAGGTIRGDIIIIDDSRGDKTQIVE